MIIFWPKPSGGGSLSTDPGIQNVVSGVSYIINGNPKVGTFVCPPAPPSQIIAPPPIVMPIPGTTLDYVVIRQAIARIIAACCKLDQNHVIMEEPEAPNAPRPPLPYMSFKIIDPGARYGDDAKTNVPNQDGSPSTVWSSGGPRKMTVSFNSYGRSHEEAYNMMALWQASLDLENVQQFLMETGIAVWIIGTVADLSQLLNTGYEGRAHMDCQFGLAMNLTSDLGEIDSGVVIGTVATDQGNNVTIGPVTITDGD